MTSRSEAGLVASHSTSTSRPRPGWVSSLASAGPTTDTSAEDRKAAAGDWRPAHCSAGQYQLRVVISDHGIMVRRFPDGGLLRYRK